MKESDYIKKLIFLIFIFIVILTILCIDNTGEIKVNNEEVKGVYISYIDLSVIKDKEEKEAKDLIDKIVLNISDIGLNTIVLQVRPFADAIYNSNIFPVSNTISSSGVLSFDILEYFINVSHDNNIKLIAWINPYRISNEKMTDFKGAIYSSWSNTTNIEALDSGTYFNPASDDVLNLILSGVEEIVKNYKIDGILYDDYFYPDKTIDLNEYSIFKENNPNVTIEEYRLNNISNLIKKTYERIKNINKDVLFGIAPSGNIENNLNDEYLDVSNILKTNYLDFVSPQLYYGFDNENKPFIDTINIWNDLILTNIKLIPSFSLYKSGLSDKYAGSGIDEWKNKDNIIKKQILTSKLLSNYKGFIIYRYDNLFNSKYQNDTMLKEIDNFKDIIKK